MDLWGLVMFQSRTKWLEVLAVQALGHREWTEIELLILMVRVREDKQVADVCDHGAVVRMCSSLVEFQD